ncbi:hypothetical protein [Flavivirga spongiicola]|uniref:Uncharacterized protein n=1 Tax=Flavivirga spongiicola TaxID=421621 RepID=A0ABU7XQL1_9FLAO|nr:hypothetical protein [Flavivirga sp. MEBiC05379]MDO5978053.1 hypothetical protein [Flavivirga sp. MEBiC05379]
MKFLKLLRHLIAFFFLTIITQVGGLVWVLALFISVKYKKKKRFIFPILYLTFNLLIIPPIAKQFGRERLPIFSKNLKPRNWIYPLFFRNYVTPNLKSLLEISSKKLKQNNIQITYLDANFPFINKFPLLPHLSHNDGKKIDISFMYLDKNRKATAKKPSVSGYGTYTNPEKNHTSESCLKKGYWQYDFSKYLTFGTLNNLKLDKNGTFILIKELLSHSKTQKIFIEPHLKQSLKLNNETKIRFHGCQAVRHDDHIHLQIK